MKTEMKPMIWFLTLLALFCAPHLASAYYDPGVQRWLSRDPLGEEGGIDLYTFVRNSPPTRSDAWGLKLTCIKWLPYWDADGYSSADDCALKEYHKYSVDEPAWFFCGLPFAWGITIYDTALFYRQQAMCKKQVCVAWR